MARIMETEGLTFGVELETTGLGVKAAADALAAAFGTEARGPFFRAGHEVAEADDPQGRTWAAMSDSSLTGSSRGQAAEVVSPVLTWRDRGIFVVVCNALRVAGAKVDGSCGAHVHVGKSGGWTVADVVSFARFWGREENIMLAAAGTRRSRIGTWCRMMAPATMNAMNDPVADSAALAAGNVALARRWFHSEVPPEVVCRERRVAHYNGERYHALNLNNLWRASGTIELRLFEGTLNPSKIEANVALALALGDKARRGMAQKARPRVAEHASGKYDWHVLAIQLGLMGPEFETARRVMRGRLAGDSGFKTAAQRAAAS